MKTNRIEYLEGLRGLAALLIVLHHYAQAFVPGMFSKNPKEYHLPGNLETWLFNTPLKLPLAGSVWLFVFLILSGLVITLGFIQHKRQTKWLLNLSLNRYFRLIGPILTVGILIFLAMKMGLGFNTEASQISGSVWWLSKMWQFEPNIFTMLWQQGIEVFYRVLPIETAYNSSLWVIPFFFIGTFILAGTLGIGKYLGKWRYLLFVGVTILFGKTFYFPLILGTFLGEALGRKNKEEGLKGRLVGWTALILGIYLGTYPTWTWPSLMANSWYARLPQITLNNEFGFYHASGAMLLIAALTLLPQLQKWLSWRGFLFLGKISFALYVVHLLFINTLASWLVVSLHNLVNYNLILLLIAATCLPLTIFLAYGINKYAEKPMGRMKLG